MIEDYINLDTKKMGIFIGSVLGTTVVVTLLYWIVFGFDQWKGQMEQASSLMTAAATMQQQSYGNSSNSGQFVCPLHGAVGLPNYNASGMPCCPICGQLMQFYGASNYLPQAHVMPQNNTMQRVAWGGGGGGGGGGG
nr:magnetosome protein Mad4 [Desulfobacteraceae bacterium]